MSQPSLTSGEVAVLRIIAESGDLRWWRPIDVQRRLPDFPSVLVRSALSRLRRHDLATPLYRGFDTFYAITTKGESVLTSLNQTQLFA